MIDSVKPLASSLDHGSVVQEVFAVLKKHPVFYDGELAGLTTVSRRYVSSSFTMICITGVAVPLNDQAFLFQNNSEKTLL